MANCLQFESVKCNSVGVAKVRSIRIHITVYKFNHRFVSYDVVFSILLSVKIKKGKFDKKITSCVNNSRELHVLKLKFIRKRQNSSDEC